jgi:hypothetical protein
MLYEQRPLSSVPYKNSRNYICKAMNSECGLITEAWVLSLVTVWYSWCRRWHYCGFLSGVFRFSPASPHSTIAAYRPIITLAGQHSMTSTVHRFGASSLTDTWPKIREVDILSLRAANCGTIRPLIYLFIFYFLYTYREMKMMKCFCCVWINSY